MKKYYVGTHEEMDDPMYRETWYEVVCNSPGEAAVKAALAISEQLVLQHRHYSFIVKDETGAEKEVDVVVAYHPSAWEV